MPVVFCEWMQHRDINPGEDWKATSAGMFKIVQNGVSVYGESDSLGLRPILAEDATLLRLLFTGDLSPMAFVVTDIEANLKALNEKV